MKGAQVRLVLAQQCDDFGQVGGLGVPEAVGQAGGGDIDAVEHVADIVQDARRHFRHAGLTRRLTEL